MSKKRGNFFADCFVLAGVLFSGTSAFGHELFYDGSPVAVRWNDVSSRVVRIKINGDYLETPNASHYSIAKTVWNNSPRVSVTQTAFTSSNVDLATASESYWNNRYGEVGGQYVFGYMDAVSTDGVELKSAALAKSSSRKIKHANLLYSPFTDRYEGTTHIRLVMVHEIGHALGLGHPDDRYSITNAASVMRAEWDGNYYTLQAHDNTDLNNMY